MAFCKPCHNFQSCRQTDLETASSFNCAFALLHITKTNAYADTLENDKFSRSKLPSLSFRFYNVLCHSSTFHRASSLPDLQSDPIFAWAGLCRDCRDQSEGPTETPKTSPSALMAWLQNQKCTRDLIRTPAPQRPAYLGKTKNAFRPAVIGAIRETGSGYARVRPRKRDPHQPVQDQEPQLPMLPRAQSVQSPKETSKRTADSKDICIQGRRNLLHKSKDVK